MNMTPAEIVLEECREHAKSADFESIANVVSKGIRDNPEIRIYVTSKIPALILENYLRNKVSLVDGKLDEWFLANAPWQNSIKDAAASPAELSKLVSFAIGQLSSAE